MNTVDDLIKECRALLQDTVSTNGYRYSDEDMIRALNIAVLEARRLRPELFMSSFAALPSFGAKTDALTPIEPMYRPAFTYYVAGRMQLRDDEPSQDARATVLMNKFVAQLLTIAS